MVQTVMSQAARNGAAFIAITTAITLAVRLYLRAEQSSSLWAALSYMSQYFTILTNTLTLLLMLMIAFGRRVPPRITLAIIIAIVCVGLIYHSLLAHLVDLKGLELWADHGTHTIVPFISGIWWLFLSPKSGWKATDMVLWIAWPLTYCAYILVRASFSGFYPYPFINLPELGWKALAINIVGLSIGFVLVGLLLVGLGRVFSIASRSTAG